MTRLFELIEYLLGVLSTVGLLALSLRLLLWDPIDFESTPAWVDRQLFPYTLLSVSILMLAFLLLHLRTVSGKDSGHYDDHNSDT